MKKVSITILLLLPIVLIYAISLLGRIVSTYSRIGVDYVEVLVMSNPIENNDTLTYNFDEIDYTEPIEIEINAYPTFATNKKCVIYNSDSSVSNIVKDEEGLDKLMLYKPGISYYTIESDDNKSAKLRFAVKNIKGELKEIRVYDKNKSSTDYLDSITIPTGKSKQLGLDYSPLSTLEQYKDCTWTVEDPTIVQLDATKTSATLSGLKAGTTNITITSDEMPSVSKTLQVIVQNQSDEDAYFNFFVPGYAFVINQSTFDFKVEGGVLSEGKIIINNQALTYNELVLECTSGVQNINVSRLNSEKVIEFTSAGKVAQLSLYKLDNGAKIFLDKISVLYREVK